MLLYYFHIGTLVSFTHFLFLQYFLRVFFLWVFLFFTKFIFLNSLSLTAKLRGRYIDFPYLPLPPHVYSLPHYQHPQHLLQWRTYSDTSKSPTTHSLHDNSLLVVHILWVWDKCIMTYIHYYHITVFSLP